MVLCRGYKIYFFNALLSVVEQTHVDWWYAEAHIQVIPQMQLYSIVRLHQTSNIPKIQGGQTAINQLKEKQDVF